MHATMIMLIDLYERPNSKEAPRSRAFIDEVFSLSGPDGGVVGGEDGVSVQRPLREGGREAWDMLRRLREKAWQKSGLDPDILWTEQDQIEVGAAQPPKSPELMLRALREGSVYQPKPSADGSEMPEQPNIADAYKELIKASHADIDEARQQQKQAASDGRHQLGSTDPKDFKSSVQQPNHKADMNPSIPEPTAFHPPSYFMPPSYWPQPSSLSKTEGSTTYSTLPVPSNPPPPDQFYAPQPPIQTRTPETSTAAHSTAATTIMPGNTPAEPAGTGPLDDASETHHFDWDQWDAVFGQYVPVDDFMDLDNAGPWSLGGHANMDELGE